MRRIFPTLWFQALAVSSVIIIGIGVAGYIVAKNDYDKKLKSKSAQQAPVLSTETTAKRGETYLKEHFDQIDPQQRLILDFLNRKFRIADEFSGATKPIVSTSKNPDVQREFAALQRIAYPDRLEKNLSGASLVTRAANCDHVPLPKDYSQQLEREISLGGYQLTHVAFSVQITKELGCNVILADPLMKQAREGMIALAGNPATAADLRYESIAFLQYMGFRKDVNKQWIDQIVSEQQQDGSWSPGGGAYVTVDHSTTLALWALLEYNYPNTPYEALISH